MKAEERLFTSLVNENKDKIFRICCYYVEDPDSRKDLYQEVLLNIWKGFKSFRGEASYLTWMLRITINTALRFLSKERSKRKKEIEYGQEIEHENGSEKDDGINQLNELHRAINRLPLIDMMIVSLMLEGADANQIAKVIGLTPANVRVRIHRAKAQIRKIVEGGEI